MDELFGFLDELDGGLADGRPFLLGAKPTLADILTCTLLVRFDADTIRCFGRPGGDSRIIRGCRL